MSSTDSLWRLLSTVLPWDDTRRKLAERKLLARLPVFEPTAGETTIQVKMVSEIVQTFHEIKITMKESLENQIHYGRHLHADESLRVLIFKEHPFLLHIVNS